MTRLRRQRIAKMWGQISFPVILDPLFMEWPHPGGLFRRKNNNGRDSCGKWFTNKWDEPFKMPCKYKAFLEISLFKVKPLEQGIERCTA